MPNCKSVYEPKEDSTMLEKYVRQYAKGSVLDIGTGSGLQAITAAHNNNVSSVIAIDIQKETIEYCKKNIKNKKITFLVSDLFQILENNRKLRKKFDAIIFNPPYLPDELKLKDLTIEGGKKGYETLEKFINKVNNYLKPNGVVLIIFSSLTKKEKIIEFVESNLLEFKLLEKQNFFFEDLYIYLIKKSPMLMTLENKNIQNIRYFTKGKRGYIFVGNINNKKVAIKIKNPKSKAIARIENEIEFLKILNKKNIGPKLLFSDNNFLAYEFVDGISFQQYLENNNKKSIIKIIKNIFRQLFELDKLKINKEEMSHPQKHILVNNKNRPVLLDFERCRYTAKPGNVTQFSDFLTSKKVISALKEKKIVIDKTKIINLARIYKKNQSKGNFDRIVFKIK